MQWALVPKDHGHPILIFLHYPSRILSRFSDFLSFIPLRVGAQCSEDSDQWPHLSKPCATPVTAQFLTVRHIEIRKL